MAVSLKKRDKVDLSKPDIPPKVREYTPVHLLDEEETIVDRSRFPPSVDERALLQQIEHSVKEITPVDLDIGNIRFKRSIGFYLRLFIPVIFAGLVILIIFLFSRLALLESSPAESTETVSTPVETVTSSPVNDTVDDTAPTAEKSIEDLMILIGKYFMTILKSPVFILFLSLSCLCLISRLILLFKR